ncbi:MAG TPA: relaxase/mobilization nuclease domain-containing protein [Segetibacter sp.]
MVARINTPATISRALNYNENKVKNGQAELLHAEGFLKDTEQLNFHDKLERFMGLIELNGRAKTNSLHISLNFDNGDKIDTKNLVEIAEVYMRKIGFVQQPYLVYQHLDAGHPHLHIVTSSIREDGSRIDTFNIGRNQSEKARKEIEKSFGLIRAEDSKQRQVSELQPVSVPRVQYGRTETKRAITNVLNVVLDNYKFTSLAELNAVLKLYNVMADRGSENSRIYMNNGLTYRLLDIDGNKVGVPIKASDFYNKPTLKNIEERFAANETARQVHKSKLKNTIDIAFLKQPQQSLQGLDTALQKEGIKVVLRQNKEGIIYGLTYVDHRTKCVFNGSDLGKPYSAKGILERCSVEAVIKPSEKSTQLHLTQQHSAKTLPAQEAGNIFPEGNIPGVIDNLLQPVESISYIPHQLKKNKKKKRKNINNS